MVGHCFIYSGARVSTPNSPVIRLKMVNSNTRLQNKIKNNRKNENEIVGGAPNEVFPFIIVVTMANSDVSTILVEKGSTSDIIYEKLFTKLGFTRDILAKYDGTYPFEFNGTIMHPWGT